MFFEVEDYRPDTPNMPRALTPLEAILLTLLAYAFIAIAYLVMPARWFQQTFPVAPPEPQQIETFVQLMPHIDKIAPPKVHTPAAVASAPKPENPLPRAQAPVDQAIAAAEDKPKGPEPPTPVPATPPVTPLTDAIMPPADTPVGGGIGAALHNLGKYLQDQSFNNPQGGGQDLDNSPLEFDAKGVDFDPWIRRFIATVKHNWNIPQAAQLLKGHVSITFYVHKDGRITDVTVVKPSNVDSFNLAAKNALLTSNPTMPIPKEYPNEACFFTVTFYYNERPPSIR